MLSDVLEEQVAAEARALITDAAVLCFGTTCPLRGHCARYLAGDGVMGVRTTIDTCMVQNGFPMFIEVRPICSSH